MKKDEEVKELVVPENLEDLKILIKTETFYPVLDTLKNLLYSTEEKNRLSAANTLTEMMGLRGSSNKAIVPSNQTLNQFNLFSPKEAKGFLKAVKELSSKGEINDYEDTIEGQGYEITDEEEEYE